MSQAGLPLSTRPKRILYVERPPTVGGSVISMFELVSRLDRTQFEPIILFHRANPYQEKFQDLGITTLVIDRTAPVPPTISSAIGASKSDITRRLSHGAPWLLESYSLLKRIYWVVSKRRVWIRRLADLIKEHQIDLVHHNNSLYGNVDSIIAARLAKVRQVCHIRAFTGFTWLEKFTARYVDQFIYISQAVQESYHAKGIVPEQGRIIHNPVNLEKTVQPNECTADCLTRLRAEFGLNGNDVLITNIGRLDWWKGQDYFIEAIAQLAQTHPHVKGLIVGKPDLTTASQTFEAKLKERVVDQKLTDHIIFTGFRSDVPLIIAASDMVVHSASEPEPFGRVIIEAMAAAKPIIATGAGGVLDIVQDEKTGLLVPLQDAGAMAQAIRYLITNPERARQMAQAGRQRAETHFSAGRHVTAVQQLYKQLVSD